LRVGNGRKSNVMGRLKLALFFTAQASMALPSVMHLVDVNASPERVLIKRKPTSVVTKWLHRHGGLEQAEHAVLVDAQGAWAWNPLDSHAAAQRHHSLASWVEKNPNTQLRVFASGPLVHSVCHSPEDAALDETTARGQARQKLIASHGEVALNWPLASWGGSVARGVCALAGINLKALARHAGRHAVKVKSVEPWWHHAFEESKRCVSELERAQRSHVCVVEGQQIAWITAERGELSDVRQTRLATPTLSALRTAMRELTAQTALKSATSNPMLPVILGQGLTDGARTRDLDAIVLGRLDGTQPPHWLRPNLRTDFH
jgi:hypothetical protein